MSSSDQTRDVRIIADGHELNVHAVGLENQVGPANHQFATRLSRKPPPTAMRSVRRQAFSFRKRRITPASSWAKSSIAPCTNARRFRLSSC
jgi:hypothetical protein